jgi:hypothetical protein
MRIQRTMRTALKALRRNPMRAMLTTLGIVIGIGAVIAMKLYTEGETEFLNVLSAQRSLLNSEDALAQSTQAMAVDLIALYKALGGGWEDGAQ